MAIGMSFDGRVVMDSCSFNEIVRYWDANNNLVGRAHIPREVWREDPDAHLWRKLRSSIQIIDPVDELVAKMAELDPSHMPSMKIDFTYKPSPHALRVYESYRQSQENLKGLNLL